MSLLAWYPFNGTLENKGLDGIPIEFLESYPAEYSEDGKIASKTLSFTNSTVNKRLTRPQFDKVDDFSYCCWFNIPDVSTQPEANAHYMINQARSDYNSDGWGIGIRGKSSNINELMIRYGNVFKTNSFTPNNWFHFTFTVDKDGLTKYYINGELIDEQLATIKPDYSEGDGTFTIGAFKYASGTIYPINGKIQDFRYYDECLSPLQIREISKGLILHYNFEDPIVPYTNTDYDNLFSQYNNYKNSWGRPEEMASTSQVLDETFEGHRIYRITLTPTGNDGLTSITTLLRNQGVCFANSDTSYKTFYIDPGQYVAYGLLYRVVSHQHNQVSVGGTAANKFSVSQTPVTHYCDNWYRVGQIKKNTTSSRNSDGVYISIMCPSLQLNESVIVDFCQPEEYLDCSSLPPRASYEELPETIIKDSSGFENDGTILSASSSYTDVTSGVTVDTTFVTKGSDSVGNYFSQVNSNTWSGLQIPQTSADAGKTYRVSGWFYCLEDTKMTVDGNATDSTYGSSSNDACFEVINGAYHGDSKTAFDIPAGKWVYVWQTKRIKSDAVNAKIYDNFSSRPDPNNVGKKIYYKSIHIEEVKYGDITLYNREPSEGSISLKTNGIGKGKIFSKFTPPDTMDEITCSSWIYIDPDLTYNSYSTIYANSISKDDIRTGFGFTFDINTNSRLRFWIYYGNGNENKSIIEYINYKSMTKGWHLFTAVANKNKTYVYIDGVLTNQNDHNYNTSIRNSIDGYEQPKLVIFSRPTISLPDQLGYDLIIDDLRIYATVLSSEDIKKMYEVKARMDNHNNVLANNFIEYNKIELLGDEIKQCLEEGHDSASALYRYDAQIEVTNTYENGKLHITRQPNSTGAQSTNYAGWSITNLRNILQADHTYLFEFDMEGYNDGNVPLDRIYLTYKPGWNTVGGLSATNIGNWMHSNYEGYTHYQTKFTLKNSWMWKTATKTESDVISGESYPCHDKIFVNLTYAVTGSRGTDLYFYNIHLYDITESKDINIDKKYNLKVISTNQQIIDSSDLYDMPIKQLDDGSIWARIFYHNCHNGTVLFTDDNEALNCNMADKYSRLYLLDDTKYKGTDGKFEFMITCPIDRGLLYNRWKQTNNPNDEYYSDTSIIDGKVVGYEAIHIDVSKGSSNIEFGGLARSSNNSNTLWDGLVKHSYWWYSIGCKYNYYDGMPIFYSSSGSSAQGQQDVELWLRVDNTSIDKTELDRVKMNLDRSITANDFIEI